MAEALKGYSQLQARFKALAGPQKMKLMAAVVSGELRRESPGQRTRMTANSWQVGAVSESHATVTGSIVNLWLDEGTGIYGPLHRKITPRTARALRWAASASKGMRLSGAPRAVKGNAVGYAYARSVKGMKPRPFINRSISTAGGKLGATIVKTWDDAA